MRSFNEIKKSALAGDRISCEDANILYAHPNLAELGELANEINHKKNNHFVFYNINRHVNPTNVCVLTCKFCSFSKKPGDEGAFSRSIDEMIEEAQKAVDQGATEIHMVGGLHPRWSFNHYVEMIKSLKDKFPSLHLKGFTAVELDWFSKKTRRPVEEVLKDLQDAGLGSLPGGGAEIFAADVREKICETKVSAERWIEIHHIAHKLGYRSNATMLYGHIETTNDRVEHMKLLREQQDISQGFQAFIPLSFQPHNNHMGINRFTNGADDLRNIAVARIFLDNFQHIKAYWIMLGQDIAQMALRYGANDLDGTVVDEKISKMAGGRAGKAMDLEVLKNLITKAGKTPIERDTLYNPLETAETLPFKKPLEIKPNTAFKAADINTPRIQGKTTTISEFLNEVSIQKSSNKKLACKLSQIPISSPHRPGDAINQHPIYKVLPLVVHYGVDEFEFDLEGVQPQIIKQELERI